MYGKSMVVSLALAVIWVNLCFLSKYSQQEFNQNTVSTVETTMLFFLFDTKTNNPNSIKILGKGFGG